MLQNPSHQYYQHYRLSNYRVIRLILFEFLSWSSWNLVCKCHAIWGYLSGTHHKSFPFVIPTLRPCQSNSLKITKYPSQSSWNLVCTVHHAIWGHLNSVLYKSLPVVVPTFHLPKLYCYWLHYVYILKFSFFCLIRYSDNSKSKVGS
jgi:hypothetical protein